MTRFAMRAVTRLRWPWAATLAALLLAGAVRADAGFRIGKLDLQLTERGVTVNVALLDALAPFHEGLRSGIPTHVRYTVELWQHHRYWPDSLLLTKVVERALAYNLITKEYRVASLQGEARPSHVTRELQEAERLLSEVRGLRLTPAAGVEPLEGVYVRVRAEAALNGEHSLLMRLAGAAGQALRQSEPRSRLRVP
jgi:hypothetical protein